MLGLGLGLNLAENRLPPNLITNFRGQTGDNTNFSQFSRVADSNAPGGAAFEVTADSGVAYSPDTPIPIDAARDYLAALALEFAPRNLLGPDAGLEYTATGGFVHTYSDEQTGYTLEELGLVVGEAVSGQAEVWWTGSANSAALVICFIDAAGNQLTVTEGPWTGHTQCYHYDTNAVPTVNKVENIIIPAGAVRLWCFIYCNSSTGSTSHSQKASFNKGPVALPYETTIAPNYQLTVLCQDNGGNTTGTFTLESGTTAKSYAQLQDAIAAAQWPAGTTQVSAPQITVTTSDGSPATIRTAWWIFR